MKMDENAARSPASPGEIVEAWCAGRISSASAIAGADLDGFGELLDLALRSDTPLRLWPNDEERRQADGFLRAIGRR